MTNATETTALQTAGKISQAVIDKKLRNADAADLMQKLIEQVREAMFKKGEESWR